jgi:hypothetical protein
MECSLAWDSPSGLHDFGRTSGLFIGAAFIFTSLVIYATYNCTRKDGRKRVEPQNWVLFAFALAAAIPVGGLVCVTFSRLVRTLLGCL